MINPFVALRQINPLIKDVVEFPLSSNMEIGYQCIVYLADGHPYADGYHLDRNLARRIAIAEAFERATFEKIIFIESLRRDLLIDNFPDTSGFAAGFDQKSTQNRSFAEGLERWARSVWYDQKLLMDEIIDTPPLNLTVAARHVITFFDSYLFLKKNIQIGNSNLTYGLFLGFKENGVYAGSRVTNNRGDIWTHATIEALRNLNFNVLSSVSENANWKTQKDLSKKIKYFAENGMELKKQVLNFQNSEWPKPKVRIHKRVLSIPGVYVWRTLFDNYAPFSLYPLERFIF